MCLTKYFYDINIACANLKCMNDIKKILCEKIDETDIGPTHMTQKCPQLSNVVDRIAGILSAMYVHGTVVKGIRFSGSAFDMLMFMDED